MASAVGLWWLAVSGGLGLACVSTLVCFCCGRCGKQSHSSVELELGQHSEMREPKLYPEPQLYEKSMLRGAPPESRELAKPKKLWSASLDSQGTTLEDPHEFAPRVLPEVAQQDLQESEQSQDLQRLALHDLHKSKSRDLQESTSQNLHVSTPQDLQEVVVQEPREDGLKDQLEAGSQEALEMACSFAASPIQPPPKAGEEPAMTCDDQDPGERAKVPAESCEEAQDTAAGSEQEMAFLRSTHSLDNFCREQMTHGSRLLSSGDMEGAMDHFARALSLYSCPEALRLHLQGALTPEQLHDPCMQQTRAILSVYLKYIIEDLLHEEPNTTEN